IGKKDHPEADAVLSLGPSVHLITGTQSINELSISNEKIFVTNQTTMSIHDIASTMKEIQNRYPSAVLAPEVCDATRMRQQAVLDLKNTDVLVVVGDHTSNNTSQLASIGSAAGINEIYKIETAQELPVLNIDRTKNIAVTAGASTPRCLTDSVIHYLETGNEKLLIPDISKMLD
ncbi:MAG: 4-hydroxy-3-methylbut-2-enyl diphosphate reductase, partial [Erysipelotrichaceae bacterium]|nr:4-hydroxy-3-methylbut-2-enyl diphosphate reductase [Erysipelotrichaceae bacterium]